MATYAEISDLLSRGGDQGLRGRVKVAVMVTCEAIKNEIAADPQNPTAAEQQRKRWAQQLLRSINVQSSFDAHHKEVEQVYRLVLMANRGAPLISILAVTDVQIQNAVDGVVGFFIQNFPDPLPAP